MTDAPADLVTVRAAIDALDRELVTMLARRQALVKDIVEIKRRERLPAFIPDRIESVVSGVRARAAEAGLDPALAERVWRTMIAHFVAVEEAALSQDYNA